MVPPGLEPHVYIIDNQLVIKSNGTRWVPTESVTAFTLSQSSLGCSPVWTSLFFNMFLSKKSLYYVYNIDWYRIINKLLLVKKTIRVSLKFNVI